MTICKPAHKKISRELIESNDTILDGDEFHVCYSDPLEPQNPVGYVNCEQDFEYFCQILDWLNDSNLAALIWIEGSDIAAGKKIILPETLGPNLCFTYEGFFTEKNLLEKFLDANKILDNFLSPAITWMLDKKVKEKNMLVFMGSAGVFTKFGYYSWYLDQEITFCIYGKASKNSTAHMAAGTQGAWEGCEYDGYCG